MVSKSTSGGKTRGNTAQKTGRKPAAKKTTKSKTARGKTAARSKVPVLKAAGKSLVIVESPAKARTVGQILGNKYVVAASQGHVRDLPKSKLGVDVEQQFEPSYVVMKDKQKLLNSIKKAGDEAKEIYLATDPDREGEAISWHLLTAAQWQNKPAPPKRVVFHEITKQAVEEAFQHPREIDLQLVNAQQARRILDRLVGYQVSPLLWRRVQRGTSAGRVQSAALRMVVDREEDIQAFVPVESWTLEAQLYRDTDPEDQKHLFTGVLHSIRGGAGKGGAGKASNGRLTIDKEEEARVFQDQLKDAAYAVADVRKREVRQRPAAPFTTSTMQQEAGRKLRFTAQRTMAVAQQLYEGLAVGERGQVGLITYMRTDSPRASAPAIDEAREYVAKRYGKDYLPEKAREYSTRAKNAQEAHEAIRPTSIGRTPDSLSTYLSKEQLDLYSLIWARMLASQMADARSESTTVDIDAACKGSNTVYMFRATGSVLTFPGFRTLYLESRDDDEEGEGRQALPALAKGNGLGCEKLDSLQHFTQPPPKYTEATLIKMMEEKGIGRPSTYAPTIGTLTDRNYVEKERNRLTPTTLGTTVCKLLTEYFSDVMDLDFTAKMEEELDDVSRGDRDWVPMLGEFYDPFQKALEAAQESMPKVNLDEETEEVCDACGKPMVIKTGRFGRFLACTGFPECRTTKPIVNKTGVACPKCGGDIVERRSRGRGRSFFGCSKYPDCDFISNRKPVPTPCPECEGLMVESGRDTVACTVCDWTETVEETMAEESMAEQSPGETAPVGG
ncbi:MAG: DNA topoisomerase I [SAR202 cluster bacterium Io17-Chloro-G9]|nr:MAG: DNA topoisomerase I [SAR202 cluster bacterium Io17-Chloro-G9]